MTTNVDILLRATDRASGPIGQVRGALQGLGSTATGVVSTGLGQVRSMLGGALVAGTTATVAAVGALAGAVGVAGVKFNNMREQAQIAFTTMLGDGGKAKAFLDDLQAFAAKTPFEFPDLVSASQKLLAMGFNADKVRPTLTAIGDAVAGLGGGAEMVDRVTTALGQMQAKGKASSEEMMQLTEAGIPAWEMLASKIGVDIPTAMDMVSKGAVSADTAIGALVDGMNAKFGGLMEKQSATFGGLLSTLKDTFTQLSGKVMGPLFERMTDGLAAIVDWTSKPEFTAGVERLAEWLGQVIDKGINLAMKVLPPVWSALTSIYEVVRLLITGDFRGGIFGMMEDDPFINALFVMRDLVMSAYHHISKLIEWAAKAIGEFVSWRDVLIGVGAVIAAAVIPALASIVAAFAPVIALVAGAIAAVSLMRNAWENDWLGIRTAVEDAWNLIRPIWEGIGQRVSDLWKTMRYWFAMINNDTVSLGEGLSHIWTLIADAFTTIWSGIVETAKKLLPPFVAKLKEWGTAAWEWIQNAIPKALEKLAEWGAKLWEWLKDKLPDWVRRLADWGTAAWEWITKTAIPKALEKLSEWGTRLWDWLRERLPEWRTRLLAWGEAAWEWIQEATGKAVTQLMTWGSRLWEWLQSNLPGWKQKLLDWGTAAWEWIQEAAPKAMQQLTAWGQSVLAYVQEKLPEWQKKLADWATAAWEWIKGAIPQVLAKLGEWLGAALKWLGEKLPDWIAGFLEWQAAVWKWIGEALPKAITAFGEWLKGIMDWGKKDGQKGLGEMIGEWVKILWKWVKDELWPKLQPALVELGTSMGTALLAIGRALWEVVKDVGRNIMQGIRDGFTEKWNQFTEWSGSIWDGWVSRIRSFFRMGSPSKLMRDIFRDIMEGGRLGAQDGTDGIYKVVDTMASGMQSKFASLLSDVNAYGERISAAAAGFGKALQSLPAVPPPAATSPMGSGSPARPGPANVNYWLTELASQASDAGASSLASAYSSMVSWAERLFDDSVGGLYRNARGMSNLALYERDTYDKLQVASRLDSGAGTLSGEQFTDALFALIEVIRARGLGNQFQINMTPGYNADTPVVDLQNMITWMNALYGDA